MDYWSAVINKVDASGPLIGRLASTADKVRSIEKPTDISSNTALVRNADCEPNKCPSYFYGYRTRVPNEKRIELSRYLVGFSKAEVCNILTVKCHPRRIFLSIQSVLNSSNDSGEVSVLTIFRALGLRDDSHTVFENI